jgi:hypothetical protein
MTSRTSTTRRADVAMVLVVAAFLVGVTLVGCRVHAPAGEIVEPVVLGTTVDQINLQQQLNADHAKLIVYAHEFEINAPSRPDGTHPISQSQIRGIKLTPAGQDHVMQIVRKLQADYLSGSTQVDGQTYLKNPRHLVTVERSETSKLWRTKYHYPVHLNAELDELRRQLIANVLQANGVFNANELVVIAPAFPTGINGSEAGTAYSNAYGVSSRSGGSLNSSGRF